MDAAAYVALAGGDWWRFLTSEEPLIVEAFQVVAQRANEIRSQEREEQAVLIANKVREMLG